MSNKKPTNGKSRGKLKLSNGKSKGKVQKGKGNSVKSKLTSKSKSKSVKAKKKPTSKSTSSPSSPSKTSKSSKASQRTSPSSKSASGASKSGGISSNNVSTASKSIEVKSGKQSSNFSSVKSKQAKQKQSMIVMKSKSKSTSAAASSTTKKSTQVLLKDLPSNSSSSRTSPSLTISKPRSAATTSLPSPKRAQAMASNSTIFRCPESYEREWCSSTKWSSTAFQPFIGATMVIEHHGYDLDLVITVVPEITGVSSGAPFQTPPPSPPPPPPPARANRRAERVIRSRVSPETLALLAPGPGLLERAQRTQFTRTGQQISANVISEWTTLAALEQQRQKLIGNPRSGQMLMSMDPPYTEFSIITSHLVLTGFWGLVAENVAELVVPLGLVVNVTREAPKVAIEGITFIRIPVDDAESENLSMYFDEVTQRIRDFQAQNKSTIVHCHVGVSRSASVVIAYLMRFQEGCGTLAAAFTHVRSVRGCVRPNISFLQQLADYEETVTRQRGPWREHTENGVTKSLPVFILEREEFMTAYAHLFYPP